MYIFAATVIKYHVHCSNRYRMTAPFTFVHKGSTWYMIELNMTKRLQNKTQGAEELHWCISDLVAV